jgi:aryl-alcohol dehydrogenase-like predicted oxidoreductase
MAIQDAMQVTRLGHSEEVVARALEGVRDRPYVFTKCSMVWDDRRKIRRSLKADSIRRECEASLRRLKVDAIDLYQIHWPEPDQDVEEGWGALADLKEKGKVRYIGVSNFSVAQMRRTVGDAHGRTPGEVAVAWVLRNSAVTGAIVGARRPGQVSGVIGAAAFRLSPRELAEIEAFFAKNAG